MMMNIRRTVIFFFFCRRCRTTTLDSWMSLEMIFFMLVDLFDIWCENFLLKDADIPHRTIEDMESILSVQDEIYPLKSPRNKSSNYLSYQTDVKTNHFSSKIHPLRSYYRSMRNIVAQRSLYILGVFNLFLAGLAIFCATQAEDHPEYFSLVYVSIGVFVFYMSTILFIIVLQIFETYREQNIRQPVPIVVRPILRTKTRLPRSQTLPFTSLRRNSRRALSCSLSNSSSSCKESQLNSPQRSARFTVLSKTKRYQSFSGCSPNLSDSLIKNNVTSRLSLSFHSRDQSERDNLWKSSVKFIKIK